MSPFAPRAALAGRRSKFGNIKTMVDGLNFDSRKEADRWSVLRILERAGQITNLRRQPEFPLTVNGTCVAKYKADFAYHDSKGSLVVEDVKSPITRKDKTYRLKNKLMAACHGIRIVEV